jgi:hypothetical protein
MKFTPVSVTSAVIALLAATLCVAQTPSPPASTTTPSSASSPSQREATRSPAAETGTAPRSDASDTSTPHQRQAMGDKAQTMKQCMDAQAAKTSAMTQSEMTKVCNDQMKMQKDREHLAEAPAKTPNGSGNSTTPAPK